MRRYIPLLLSGAALLSGCATKNYVRENVDPLQSKLDQVSQQVSQQGTELQQTRQDVDKNATAISATDEKATAADQRATDALNRMKQNQQEINQLGRQCWVSKDQVKANKYDLSASRYRQVEQDAVF